MSSDSLLYLDRVSVGYGATPVIPKLSLSLMHGERVALIGRNGAGKSTLLSAIMGRVPITSGKIYLRGQEISRMAPHRRAALGLGLVPQHGELFASLTVEENLRAAIQGGADLDEAYSIFPPLAVRRHALATELPAAERKMLAIARTLMSRPEVLLIDEPLEGMAPLICALIMNILDKLVRDSRVTILLVDQHTELALNFAERAFLMETGQIIQDVEAAILRRNPEMIARHLGPGMAPKGRRSGG